MIAAILAYSVSQFNPILHKRLGIYESHSVISDKWIYLWIYISTAFIVEDSKNFWVSTIVKMIKRNYTEISFVLCDNIFVCFYLARPNLYMVLRVCKDSYIGVVNIFFFKILLIVF